MVIWARIVLLALLSISMGCASLDGRAVPSGTLSNAESAKGISYYLPKPTFAILRKGLAGGKKAVLQYEVSVGSVADESKRFEVGMSQGLFTSDTFDLKLGPGQTVTSLNSKRTDEVGPTVASLIGVGAAVLPMVAKLAALLDVGDNPLLMQIFSEDDKKTYVKDTEYLQGVLTGKPRESDHEDRLKRWRANNAIIRQALINGRLEPLPEIMKIEALLKEVVKGYAYPKTTPTDTSAESKLFAVAENLRRYESLLSKIESLEDEIEKSGEDTTKEIQRAFTSLQAKVHQELLPLISGTSTNKAALNQALANLQGAIELLVKAKDPLDRNLLSRKKVLTEFLSRPLTKHADEDEANAYQKLGDEVTKVAAALSSLIGGDTQSGDPLPLGTDVTSRIDKNIFYMRPVQSDMNDFDMQTLQVPIARAIIKYAGYEAVIVIN